MNNIDAFEARIRALEGVVPLTVKFRKVHPKAQIPTKGTAHAVGWDLYATQAVDLVGTGQTVLVSTGIALELPPGYEAQIRPRSSFSKRGILTHFGTIDSDYRGELFVVVTHLERAHYASRIEAGDRIAQLVIAPVVPASFVEVEELTQTVRGTGGFGSTGR